MGSAGGDARQIDGVGGATSTTSKVAVVAKSSSPGIDVEYTFGQVGVGKTQIDFSGNCGNIASGVGPFALDEGMVNARPGQTEIQVRILNTNTSRILVATIDVDEHGQFKEDGDFSIDGVPGTGSLIRVAFLSPAGSMTGSLLPTGNAKDVIHVEGMDLSVSVSLVDAANPFVFIDASTMPKYLTRQGMDSPELLRAVENIRRVGAVMMGLSPSTSAAAATQGTPKVALVSAAPLSEAQEQQFQPADVHVTVFSMGKPHPSLQLTGAVCLGAAAVTTGTVPNRIMSAAAAPPTPERTPSPDADSAIKGAPGLKMENIRIGHARGGLIVEVETDCGPHGKVVKSAVVLRTARRLFEGNVLFYL